IGRTGDAIAGRDADAQPAGLPVRALHAVATADARSALADLPRVARLADAVAVLAKAVGLVAREAGRAGKFAVVAGVPAHTLRTDFVRGAQSVAFVDHAVTVVVLVVALLGRRLDGLPALGRHPAGRALGDTARADAHRAGNRAGIAAQVAREAGDVEDEVVEVAVVLRVAALPARRAGRQILERDVVGLRVRDRLVD